MSTRCQLRFVRDLDAGRTADPKAQVAQLYKHSDGYPEAVVPLLARVRALLEATQTGRGPAYAAAQVVLVDSLGTIQLYLDPDRSPDRRIAAATPADVCDLAAMKHLNQPLFLLGHGIEDPRHGIHGDEEYLYVVEAPPYHPGEDELSDWRVAVSTHCGFPRWDGATDTAFERAEWQFVGDLNAAVERFDGVDLDT